MNNKIVWWCLGFCLLNLSHAKQWDYQQWKNKPVENFEQPKKTFGQVQEVLKRDYHIELSEEDLYRAAVQGMIENADPAMKEWNRLLSPKELQEIRSDLKSRVVGIGIELRFEESSGLCQVLSVIEGSPAKKAGLNAGDQIIEVDGKSFKGKQMRDVVYAVRGRSGTTVRLSVLRGSKVLKKTLKRAAIVWNPVSFQTLRSKVAWLKIRSFTEKTPKFLEKALESLEATKVKALVVDLRSNGGGEFNSIVASADLLVPKDKTIVKTLNRQKKETKFSSKEKAFLAKVPVAVLINGDTSSGAEFFAVSLKKTRGAKLIGQKTRGKWSIQRIKELGNGYALKFTVSRFLDADGRSYEGDGVAADIEVAKPEKSHSLGFSNLEERLKSDAPLNVAMNLLEVALSK